MVKTLPGYNVFAIFAFIPKEIRYVEVVVILFFYIYSNFKTKKINHFNFALQIIAFVSISLISTLINGVSFVDAMQVIYMFLFPFLIISTIAAFDYEPIYFDKLSNFVKYFILLCIPAAIYGFFVFRNYVNVNPADVINVYFSDASTSANFMFILAFYELSYYLNSRKNKNLVLFIISFIIAFLGFNEKSILFFIGLMIFYLIKTKKFNLKLVISISIIGLFLSLIYYYISQKEYIRQKSLIRVELLSEIDLTSVGPIRSYLNVPLALSESIIYPFFGSGPGTYSTPIVFSNFHAGKISSIAKKYNYTILLSSFNSQKNLINSALDWTVNIFSGLIVEFGIIASIIIIFLYKTIIKRLLKISNSNIQYSYLAWPTILSLFLLLVNSLVSNVANINEIVLMVPICIYVGMLQTHFINNIKT